MSGFYPVVGRVGTGNQLRLPIVELQQSHPQQFTLLVLSLLVIQDRNADANNAKFLSKINVQGSLPIPPGRDVLPSTFLNIAAIHGKPYQIWPGDLDPKDSDYDSKDPKDTRPVPSRFGGKFHP